MFSEGKKNPLVHVIKSGTQKEIQTQTTRKLLEAAEGLAKAMTENLAHQRQHTAFM